MRYGFSIVCASLLALAINVIPASAGPSGKLGLHTVVIDAGHGGKDPGCVSADRKTFEKTLTLDISNRLKKKIEEGYKDVTVKMTRTSNSVFVPLIDRAKFATRNNADFFISVHINAQSKATNANGYSIHILGPSTDKTKDTYAFNQEVCRRENEVIYLEEDYSTNYQGLDPNDPESEIFLRLMTAAYREQSILFAQKVDEKMKKAGIFKRSNGVMQNNFAVLRLATMPAVLLELGFITNPTDLETLRQSEKIDAIVDALYEAFKEYKVLYDESVGVVTETPAAPSTSSGSATVAEQKTTVAEQKTTAAEPVEAKTESVHVETVAHKPAEEPKKTDPSTSSGTVKAPVEGKVLYGTQMLASGKEISDSDSRFLGYKPVRVPAGNLTKFIIGVSEDLSTAEKNFNTIKAKYPDAFLVKIKNNSTERITNR